MCHFFQRNYEVFLFSVPLSPPASPVFYCTNLFIITNSSESIYHLHHVCTSWVLLAPHNGLCTDMNESRTLQLSKCHPVVSQAILINWLGFLWLTWWCEKSRKAKYMHLELLYELKYWFHTEKKSCQHLAHPINSWCGSRIQRWKGGGTCEKVFRTCRVPSTAVLGGFANPTR